MQIASEFRDVQEESLTQPFLGLVSHWLVA